MICLIDLWITKCIQKDIKKQFTNNEYNDIIKCFKYKIWLQLVRNQYFYHNLQQDQQKWNIYSPSALTLTRSVCMLEILF